MAARGWATGLGIFRFFGSKAVEDSHGVGFMDLRSSAALTVFNIGKSASVSTFKVGSTSSFEQYPN